MKNAADSTLEIKVQFVGDSVAVADEYWHIAGQVYGGETKPGPDRWGRTTYIFQKANSQWTEVIERVADIRAAYYKHYDALPPAVPVPAETLAPYAGSYERAPGKKIAEITVSGDHLSVLSRGKNFTAIPTSATEFLVFNPDDLADYYKITYSKDSDATLSLTLAMTDGVVLAKATKAKAESK